MQENTDIELVENYLKGSENALDLLIKKYLSQIYNFIYRYVKNEKDAEDISQEVFVKVWKNLKKIDKNKNFKAWIFTIAKNTIIDFSKKKKLTLFSDLEKNDEENFSENIQDELPMPNEILDKKYESKILQEKIEKLPQKYQIVLFLYYKEGFNFREIGSILDESIDTIKSRNRRALIMLKKSFSEK